MNNKISFFENIKNTFYLAFTFIFNKDVRQLDEVIENLCMDIFNEFNIKRNAYSEKEFKVLLIKMYRSESENSKEINNQSRMILSKIKIEKMLAIQFIPDKSLVSEDFEEFQVQREKYMKKVQSEEGDLKELLSNSGLINLAKKIDADVPTTQSLKQFAELISMNYLQEIQMIFGENLGADKLGELYLALLLLQTNSKFPQFILQLDEHCKNNDRVAIISSIVKRYHDAITLINEIK